MVFYSMDYLINKKLINNDNLYGLFTSEELKVFGMPEISKFEVLALSDKEFILRLENLEDTAFDHHGGPKKAVPYVDINNLVMGMFAKIFGKGFVGFECRIKETGLTGTKDLSDIKAEKVQWKGADDDLIDETNLPKDKDEMLVSLESQRIRVFRVRLGTLAQTAPLEEVAFLA